MKLEDALYLRVRSTTKDRSRGMTPDTNFNTSWGPGPQPVNLYNLNVRPATQLLMRRWRWLSALELAGLGLFLLPPLFPR
jgi:hypothetical protein